MRSVCPNFGFGEAYIKTGEELQLRQSEDIIISRLVSGIGKITSVMYLVEHIAMFRDVMDEMNEFQSMLVQEKTCQPLLASVLCETVFHRCAYADCSYPQKADCNRTGVPERVEYCSGPEEASTLCFFNAAVEEWIQCADRKIVTNATRAPFSARREQSFKVMARIQQVLQNAANEQSGKQNKAASNLYQYISEEEFGIITLMLAQALRSFRAPAYEFERGNTPGPEDTRQSTTLQSSNCMPLLSEHESIGKRAGVNGVGCDPMSQSYTDSEPSTTYDSGIMFLVVFVVLSALVAVASRRLPAITFSSKRDRIARIASMCVGILSSSFIFISAIDYEAAAQLAAGEVRLLLHVWASIHLVVTLAMAHHSAYLLVSGPDVDSLPVAFLRSRSKLCDRAVHASHSCTKGHGRFFGLFLIMREIVECAVQLLGIDSSARESDYETVSTRAAVLCLNLILLPIVTFVSTSVWGQTAAKVSVVVIESVFDNLFIAIGVLLQRGTSEYLLLEGSGSFLFHLARGAPTLLPAILFCITDQTPLMILADMGEKNTLNRRDAAARKIQSWLRANDSIRAHHVAAEPAAAMGNIAVLALKKHHATERQLQHKSRRAVMTTTWALGIISFTLGVALWYHVAITVSEQEAICVSQIGSIARCLSPRMYLRSGLFAEHSECAFDAVTSIDCRDDGLVDSGSGARTKRLPEAPEIYRLMDRVTKIDVSGNAALENVPVSWHLMSGLIHVNVSFCGALQQWPYSLCATSSLLDVDGGLDVRGTPISRSLNWSGQMPWSNTSSKSALISEACLRAFAPTLERLDLSRNGIRYEAGGLVAHQEQRDALVPRLKWILDLGQLSFLNLSHNEFQLLDTSYFQLTQRIFVRAQAPKCKFKRCGVDIVVGNPIAVVRMVAEDSARAVDLVLHLGGKRPKGACANDLKRVTFIVITGESGLALTELQTSCFAQNLTILEFQATAGLFNATGGVVENETFDAFPNLEHLDMNGCFIHTIEPGTFSKCCKLDRLDLRNNNLNDLARLGSTVLNHLKQLSALVLDNNNFTLIADKHGGALRHWNLSSIDSLRLSGNYLPSLGQEDLSGMPELRTFKCKYCGLETIAKDTFSMNSELETLCLSGNAKLNRTVADEWGVRDLDLTARLKSDTVLGCRDSTSIL